MDNTQQIFLQREGHANHVQLMRQEKWTRCDEIFIWQKIDDECADNFTVLSEKSRLLHLHGEKSRVPSDGENRASKNHSAFELPAVIVLAYIAPIAL